MSGTRIIPFITLHSIRDKWNGVETGNFIITQYYVNRYLLTFLCSTSSSSSSSSSCVSPVASSSMEGVIAEATLPWGSGVSRGGYPREAET